VETRELKHNLTEKEIADLQPKRFLVQSILGIGGFILLIIVLGILFKPYIEDVGRMMVEDMGYVGMFFATIVLDTFWLPASPDVLLLFSIAGDMDPMWTLITVMIGSIIGGHIAYFLGMWIGHRKFVKKVMGRNYDRGVYLAQRYGMWAVVLGAAAPPPFSLTCWFAGMFNLKYKLFLYATLWRIPKFLWTYLFIKVGFGMSFF
jgi:membrane protein YqaA with SNARE-associated domain